MAVGSMRQVTTAVEKIPASTRAETERGESSPKASQSRRTMAQSVRRITGEK